MNECYFTAAQEQIFGRLHDRPKLTVIFEQRDAHSVVKNLYLAVRSLLPKWPPLIRNCHKNGMRVNYSISINHGTDRRCFSDQNCIVIPLHTYQLHKQQLGVYIALLIRVNNQTTNRKSNLLSVHLNLIVLFFNHTTMWRRLGPVQPNWIPSKLRNLQTLIQITRLSHAHTNYWYSHSSKLRTSLNTCALIVIWNKCTHQKQFTDFN